MGRKFAGVAVIFLNKNPRIEHQLLGWGYSLEANETLSLLWPPSPQADEVMQIASQYAFTYSSFELQAHGNINVHSADIVKFGNGLTRIAINNRTKIFKKNAELMLTKVDGLVDAFDTLSVKKDIASRYTVPDNETYLFGASGVLQMSKGMSVFLTAQNEIRHYFSGYQDCIITAPVISIAKNSESLLRDILLYYRRVEPFGWQDFETLNLSSIAFEYLEKCETQGLINSAAKRFIEEGRI